MVISNPEIPHTDFFLKDNKFLKTFITTYQSFTEPWTLFEKLKQRYNVPENSENNPALIQLRVSIVLKYWVENQLDDFDEDLVIQLKEFIQRLSNQEKLRTVAETLKNYLQEQIDKRAARTILWFQPPDKVEIPEQGLCLSDLFMELPAQQIAEQITLIDFEIFKNIEATELLNQAWNKPSLKHKSKNVLSMINRSTRLSHWVALMILSQDDVTVRAKMFEKMIDIGKVIFIIFYYFLLFFIFYFNSCNKFSFIFFLLNNYFFNFFNISFAIFFYFLLLFYYGYIF